MSAANRWKDRLVAWLEAKADKWVQEEAPHFPLKVLLTVLLLIVVILPGPDELAIPVTDTCPSADARECKKQFLFCRSVDAGIEMKGMTRVKLRNECLRSYEQRCNACGTPVDLKCRTYWERYKRLGPWWVGKLPAGQWLWKLVGPKEAPNCESRRLELGGV
ncbi:hypothetical protein LJR125_000727 [Pseudoxanthomonas sp. LjRoot125]|uniref:hypothetical protein n=1 Tax=Pseudoxanthomonas sp. LjRoot125 TaxID=3342258 RepID=UPI003E115ABB